MPTDSEMFSQVEVKRSEGGRPAVDRELGYRLLQEKKADGSQKFSTKYLMRVLHCSSRMIRELKQEMREKGIVSKSEIDLQKLDKESRDFDSECKEVIGSSFKDWIVGKQKGSGIDIFYFCRKVWSDSAIWDRPFLYDVADLNKPEVADELANKFLKYFGGDEKRIRDRITRIRRFFTFMRREDVNDRYLRLTESKHPRNKRDVPQLAFINSPTQIQEAIDEMGKRFGPEGELIVMLKIVSQMRTGMGSEKRELWGTQCGEIDHSYLIMPDENQYVFQVHAKMNETWMINWMPKEVKKRLYSLYKTRQKGEMLIQLQVEKVRKAWGEITKKIGEKYGDSGIPQLKLHDLRKVSATWYYIMGLPLEVVADINVGWKDLNTLKNFYLQIRRMITKETRKQYQDNIPAWFKEGLDQYLA